MGIILDFFESNCLNFKISSCVFNKNECKVNIEFVLQQFILFRNPYFSSEVCRCRHAYFAILRTLCTAKLQKPCHINNIYSFVKQV